MKVLLLTLVLAVVMVAHSSAKPAKVTLPPELLDKIKSKGVEIFQEYLKWKDGQPAGRGRFRTFFREWLKKQKELTPPIAEDKADEKEEAAPSQDAKDEDNVKDKQADDDETAKNSKGLTSRLVRV